MLRVLVTADELVRAAQPAGPSQGGSDSHAAGTTAGATGGGLHSLLRLQALRACVASEEAAAEAAVEGGSNEGGSNEGGSNAAAEQPRIWPCRPRSPSLKRTSETHLIRHANRPHAPRGEQRGK